MVIDCTLVLLVISDSYVYKQTSPIFLSNAIRYALRKVQNNPTCQALDGYQWEVVISDTGCIALEDQTSDF
jgi:hypothetical protein